MATLGALQALTSFFEALPMPRISLIPTRTPDGRHIIYKVRVDSNRDRIRELIRRLFGRRPALSS
jgi:hypothetical protein